MKIVKDFPLKVFVIYGTIFCVLPHYGLCSFMLYLFCMLLPIYVHCCSSQFLLSCIQYYYSPDHTGMLLCCHYVYVCVLLWILSSLLHTLQVAPLFHGCMFAITCRPYLQVSTVCHVPGLKPGQVIWVTLCPGQAGLTWSHPDSAIDQVC